MKILITITLFFFAANLFAQTDSTLVNGKDSLFFAKTINDTSILWTSEQDHFFVWQTGSFNYADNYYIVIQDSTGIVAYQKTVSSRFIIKDTVATIRALIMANSYDHSIKLNLKKRKRKQQPLSSLLNK